LWRYLVTGDHRGKTGGMPTHLVTTACPLDCPDTCSLEVTVTDGRIVKIDADTGPTANPMTQGYICQKVKHHAKRVYAPERVLTPLIRTGERGSGEFRSASWAEAATLIASRIRGAIDTDGVMSVVPYLYSSSAGVLASSGLTAQLFERLGCPDVEHTICAATVGAAWRQVYGSMLSADPFDLEHSKLVVVWGANPNTSNTHLTPLLTKAVKGNGASLVVVDPRRTAVAARADLHLAIKPGTDVVLAYAVTRWLVEHGRHDADFLSRSTEGADEFLAAAQEWTIERAAAECGVAAADIERFAELVGSTSPAMLRLGWGLERNRNGGSGCISVISLWAVAGHFGVRGSGIIKSTSGAAPLDLSRLWPAGVDRPQRPTLSMNDIGLALNGQLDGVPPTRVLFVQGANPVATAMDQAAFIRGMERDDVFSVVHDQVMTDTAVLADVVLPATTHFEVPDLTVSYGSFAMLRVDAVIDRIGESRSNDEVAATLAAPLGLPDDEFDADPARLAALVRTDGGQDSLPTLRAGTTTVQFVDTQPSFRGEPGKARLAVASSELPIPRYKARQSSALTLLTPSTTRTINSMFAEFDPPDVAVAMHASDAGSRGIADGARVRVFNELGSIELTARVDSSVRPGVVSIPKGFWRRHFDGGATPNGLIPRMVNDLASGACFNDAQVEVVGISASA
jgi:anaerobic selenocysteine-containing dehydrogenase